MSPSLILPGFVVVLACATIIASNLRLEEPFSFLEGISVWPTEIIRLLAAGLAIFFLVEAHRRLKQNIEDLTRDFGLTQPTASHDKKVDVGALWIDYKDRCRVTRRLSRVSLLTIVYFALAATLFGLHGTPTTPLRGDPALIVDTVAIVSSVTLFMILVFYVIDIVLVTHTFIRRLTRGESNWPDHALKDFNKGWPIPDGDERRALGEVLDLRLVAHRTEAVGGLVLGPFVVLALMIVSRLSYFDRWDWPVSLILVMGLNSVFALVAAVLLRNAAENARRATLGRLGRHALEARTAGKKSAVDLLEAVTKDVKDLGQGAFAPLSQQPALRALLLPFGGIGTAVLLELIATSI